MIVDRLHAGLAELSTLSEVLGATWVLVMISVPVFRWVLGSRGERIGISLGVLFQAALVATLLSEGLGLARAWPIILGIPVFGWVIELIGSRTGVPFGRYHYTDVLKPQLLHVPLVIPLAWLMMVPPAWSVAAVLSKHLELTGPAGRVVIALVAGAAFMAWDLFLDPQMVRWDFWRWREGGAYVGIPVSNFLGWFLAGTAVSFLFYVGEGEAPVVPLFAVYVVTWLLETVGQLVFWRLMVSGIVGFLIMGLFVAVGLLGLAG